MAIPVYLQQFKAAGIYRVVFDKSTILGVDSEILRLVVGYSEKGPFNIPTYVTSVSDFKAIYGDISKKLEKRGIFFHRLAIQALNAGPILCLNLKKFDGEKVDGASINTDFNPSYDTIDTVKLYVEDIYDTTRFWELSAEKLNNLRSASGVTMDQYINICSTNTKNTSGTYFIRKASGAKVAGYNLTVSDWYSDDEIPEYLKPYSNSLISDFFAEIYVFKGAFTASQVLASSTLKNYFEMKVDSNGKVAEDADGNPILKLRQYVTNAYGDPVDTLDALYNDETSNAINHYVGCLIPNFKNKQGQYASLDIVFNLDQEQHNMMMSFNVDALEEDETAHIDLSGRLSIPTDTALLAGQVKSNNLSLNDLYRGTAKTKLLGNIDSPVITDILTFKNNVVVYDANGLPQPFIPLTNGSRKIMGTLYVSSIVADETTEEYKIELSQVSSADNLEKVTIACASSYEVYKIAVKLGAAKQITEAEYDANNGKEGFIAAENDNGDTAFFRINDNGYGTYWIDNTHAFITPNKEVTLVGPRQVVTSITRIEATDANYDSYNDSDMNMRVVLQDVNVGTSSSYTASGAVEGDPSDSWAVYGSSVSFVPWTDPWESTKYEGAYALVNDAKNNNTAYDASLFSVLNVGDCFLADDGTTDRDQNGEVDDLDYFYDNVYVQELKTEVDEFGNITKYIIKFSGEPLEFTGDSDIYLIRIDAALNQEIGTMVPQYLEGYTFINDKPAGTDMLSKLKWQKLILSALTEYKGVRTALLNRANIDYRYIVDTFESFVDNECKNVLTMLAKEKQSALAILNFPSVKTFIKCPYTSFTDAKGVFNVDYVVKGFNKKKASGMLFSLPSDSNGASFGAFYTPVKFSDGYVDTIVPSAGLVSNLFIEKYNSRQPYYIIAGPNYGNVSTSGLVGPDYAYSQDELQIIEPFGVNCMMYRPNFGTYINANQTAKQTPVSALSKVNVRELVIYIQDEIEKVLQAYQWEFNNATTRNAILDKVNYICARVAANGGIQAYLNIMDESNNTPEIIDNEMAIISTHIEPGMGCGKMVQQLTLYRTGQMSATILE